MFSSFLEASFSILIWIGVYFFIAVILIYILRWTRFNHERFWIWLWPATIVIIAWIAIGDIIRWLSHFAASSLDRMIYKLTRHKIDESEYGILWEGRMPYGRHLEVEVRDSTGQYIIPVPPDNDALLVKEVVEKCDKSSGYTIVIEPAVRTSIKTAKQAVEWTYNLKDGELNPVVRA